MPWCNRIGRKSPLRPTSTASHLPQSSFLVRGRADTGRHGQTISAEDARSRSGVRTRALPEPASRFLQREQRWTRDSLRYDSEDGSISGVVRILSGSPTELQVQATSKSDETNDDGVLAFVGWLLSLHALGLHALNAQELTLSSPRTIRSSKGQLLLSVLFTFAAIGRSRGELPSNWKDASSSIPARHLGDPCMRRCAMDSLKRRSKWRLGGWYRLEVRGLQEGKVIASSTVEHFVLARSLWSQGNPTPPIMEKSCKSRRRVA